MRGENLGGYRVCVGEGKQILHFGDADSDEELGAPIPCSQHDGDIVNVLPFPEYS